MWWTDALPAAEREIVNNFVIQMSASDWRQRRELIESVVVSACTSMQEDSGPGMPATTHEGQEMIIGVVVAAILEQIGDNEMHDTDQALVYAMSADLDHQTAATDWFISQGRCWSLEGLLHRETASSSATIH